MLLRNKCLWLQGIGLIPILTTFYCGELYAQSIKEKSYMQQGMDAQLRGDYKLACENFDIAANFARIENSENYESILQKRNSMCERESRREDEIWAQRIKTQKNIPSISVSQIIAEGKSFVGKRLVVNCPSLYVSNGGALACESKNGLSIDIDVKTINKKQYKYVLEKCRGANCEVCVDGILSISAYGYIIKDSKFFNSIWGTCTGLVYGE